MAVSAPALAVRLKPVLNRGANMTVAGEGFRDGEQFATVAHAARNTRMPFMVLKHRVLDEKQSLADAIGAANPALDAAAEVRRARTAAQSDVKAVAATVGELRVTALHWQLAVAPPSARSLSVGGPD